MITARSLGDVETTRFEGELFNGTGYARTDYLGCDTSPRDTPQALLVEQAPNSVIPPHFHGIDQYQVVVQGEGTLGKHVVRPVCVHYSARYTGYGPIRAASEGLYYFTLRAQSEPGAFFLPESRHRQKPGRKRNVTADVPLRGAGSRLDRVKRIAVEPLIPFEEEGLSAEILRMGPHMQHTAPDPMQGGGQYVVVLDGSLQYGGATYPRWACVFVAPPETALEICSGPSGLEALILQFPRWADRAE